MVDTINPNTNQPDTFGNGQSVAPTQTGNTPEDRFFGGFDKPADTKINLADSQPAGATMPTQPTTSAPVTQVPTAHEVLNQQPATTMNSQPVHDVNPPRQPEIQHSTYVNTDEMINWRGVLVIAAIGVVATLIIGAGIYFGVSAMNNSNLKKQQAELDTINQELTALKDTPAPLELPATETPTVETPVVAPVVTPVETPTETPVVAPSTTVSPEDENGNALGTGQMEFQVYQVYQVSRRKNFITLQTL